MRTWQDNAAEFRELDRGEGWPFCILVACSVNRREAKGKARITEFAEAAGCSTNRISRYLEAYELAVERGWVPPLDDIGPSDVGNIEAPKVEWRDFYKPKSSVTARVAEFNRAFKREASDIVAAMSPEKRAEVAAEISRVANHAERNVKAAAAERKQEMEKGPLTPFIEADQKLWDAIHALNAAGAIMGPAEIRQDFVELLEERLDGVQDALNRAREALRTDFDAELRKLVQS